jgi:rod shape-determining protein MreD
MTKGRLEAVVAGFLFGIIWDVFSVDIFGMRMLLFPVIGYAVGLLGRNFDKDQLYTQAFIIFIANLIFLLGQALIYSSFYSENIHIFSAIFNLRNLFCLVLTVIFAIPSFLLLSIADNYFSKKRH